MLTHLVFIPVPVHAIENMAIIGQILKTLIVNGPFKTKGKISQ